MKEKNIVNNYIYSKGEKMEQISNKLNEIDEKKVEDDISMNMQLILERVFIGCALGTIYEMAPSYKPRNADKIVEDIKKYFAEHGRAVMDTHVFIINKNDRYDLVEKIMRSSESFINLNLSQDEIDRGVNVEDETRPEFSFVSRDTTIEEYYDFIDLDACIRNINSELYWDWLDNELFENRLEIVSVDKNK